MDEKLRHILKDKLENYETPVPQHLWAKVSASAPTAKVGASLIAKWVLITAAAAGIVGATMLFFKTEINSPETVAVEQVPADTHETLPSNENNPSDSTTHKETTPENSSVVIEKQTTITLEVSENSASPNTPEADSQFSFMEEKSQHANTGQASRAVTSPTEQEQVTPKAEFSFTAVPVSSRELTYFFMPVNPGAQSYHWNFGDDGQSSEMTPMHTFDEPGVYEVVLETKSNHGMEQATIAVECLPEPQWFIPSIFTPNGDGKNDTFDIMVLSKYAEPLQLTIFNSSGQVVYTCQNSAAWDGLDSQKLEAPEGNYLFKLVAGNLRHQNVEKSGFIYLQR
jgi:gliding motility-associated-like protein